jgi:osmotically-inducible protein OsmY
MHKLVTLFALASLPFLHGCLAAAVVGGAAAGGYMVGEERRQVAALAEDEAIELKIRNRVAEAHPKAHVSPVSYNRMVLLNGTAPTAAVKADLEKIARGVDNVRGVYNEIHVAPNRSFPSLAADGVLTTKVKTRMVDARRFNPLHVKVVSDDGTVYLLGLVTRKEADAASDVARTTSGVKRVVRMFEYQD